MSLSQIDFQSLGIFLRCPKRSVAEELVNKCFQYRYTALPDAEITSYASLFQESNDNIRSLADALIALVKTAIFYQCSTQEAVSNIFPGDFQTNLKNLLSTIISTQMPAWNNEMQSSQLSIPKFKTLDWNINLKTSHSGTTHSTVPTAMVKIEIENIADSQTNDHIEFEMGRETLQAMLDGLGKIRDQLQSVAAADE
ncbi:putative COMM domain containing 9 [Blattamonas nauphoetae]|uniref:COMM domain containing 9 n=1 Tax=Blattamonas nauphoetae TaxID=2049346 RepID=A0ABQ9X5U5_9EUKA|nr:putative COMM domain containing 9 [Blattamonas nauphoetae]